MLHISTRSFSLRSLHRSISGISTDFFPLVYVRKTGPVTGRSLSALHSCQGNNPKGHQQKNPNQSQAMRGPPSIQGFCSQNYHMSTCCNTVSLFFLMHLLKLVRTTTVYLKSLCHRLTLYFSVIKVSAKNSEVAVRFAREESKICTAFGPLSGRGWLWRTVHAVGLFLFLMTHILDLIPVCLSMPNRNYYLGQTAVVVLIEADIIFFRSISQLCILQSEVPSLGYFWHLAVMVLTPASSATSAILLAHTQMGNIAGELPFSYSFFSHAGSEYSIFCFQIQLSGHFMLLLLHGPISSLFSSSCKWYDPASWLSMAAASFAMFCFS